MGEEILPTRMEDYKDGQEENGKKRVQMVAGQDVKVVGGSDEMERTY